MRTPGKQKNKWSSKTRNPFKVLPKNLSSPGPNPHPNSKPSPQVTISLKTIRTSWTMIFLAVNLFLKSSSLSFKSLSNRLLSSSLSSKIQTHLIWASVLMLQSASHSQSNNPFNSQSSNNQFLLQSINPSSNPNSPPKTCIPHQPQPPPISTA